MNENGRMVDKTHEWVRPCFKNYSKVIIGDSTIRGFGRQRKAFNGMSITGFGGMEYLEFINLLQSGFLSKDRDLTKTSIRTRYQSARDEFPVIRFCRHCRTECLENFEGLLIVVMGLNNCLKADIPPFALENGENKQDVVQVMELLDSTISKMLPNANVVLTPILDVEEFKWKITGNCMSVFKKFNEQIRIRNHVNIDIAEPKRRNLYDRGGVHLRDWESVQFWSRIFESL